MEDRVVRTTFTFSEELWREVKARAKAEGVSATEWVRGAVLMRLAYEARRESASALNRALQMIRRR